MSTHANWRDLEQGTINIGIKLRHGSRAADSYGPTT